MSFLSGHSVAVMGLGKSGMSAAKALTASGAEVWAWDDNEERRRAAAAEGVPLIDLHRCDWAGLRTLVLSPGIAHTHPKPHPVVERARAAGAEIISDIELLARAQRDTSRCRWRPNSCAVCWRQRTRQRTEHSSLPPLQRAFDSRSYAAFPGGPPI